MLKKFLLVLMALMMVFTMIPTVAMAEEPGGASVDLNAELDSILVDSKLVVTDSTLSEDKISFLNAYLQKFQTSSIGFSIDTTEETPNGMLTITCSDTNGNMATRNVEVVFDEQFSDDFKSILTDINGKTIHIPTTSKGNIDGMLIQYLGGITGSNEKYFFALDGYYDATEDKWVSSFNEDFTQTTILMWEKEQPIIKERHIVNLSYMTEPSDTFKEVLDLDNLSITIHCSEDIDKTESLNNYLNSKRTNKYYFSLAKQFNENDEGCIIAMIDAHSDSVVEYHYVNVKFDYQMTSTFKKLLNDDGKLHIKSVKPENDDESWSIFELNSYFATDRKLGSVSIADDYNSGIVTYDGETRSVDFVYDYDSKVAKSLKSLWKKLNTGETSDEPCFKIQDMELVNYWVNNADKNGSDNLDNYSGELRKLFDHKNISFFVDNRAGDDKLLSMERMGIASFSVDNTIYHIEPFLRTYAECVIYVPNNTGNSKEELLKAAQKRIDDYIGNGVVTVSSEKTVYAAWLENEYEFTKWLWEQQHPGSTFGETFEQWKVENSPNFTDSEFEDVIGISGVSQTDPSFTAKIGNKEHYFIIRKDSSKMVTPTYKNADALSNVQVATSSSQVPLDTMIEVENITSGTEYDRIMKVLDVENSKIFDIKLHSASKDGYVDKLVNGKFEVKIPIDKQFEGKKLVVYYVDAKGNTTEHAVTVKGGFATFETDHFSIYTLAPKEEIKVDGGKAEVPADVIKDASAADKAEVVITVPKDKEVAEITLPVASVKEVASAKKSLTIETKTATVTLDSKALETVVDKADGAKITLKIDEIAKTTLSDKQQKAIENMDFDVIISAEILCEDKVISEDFGGGKATIELPFTPAEGKKLGDYTIVYIDNNGNLFRIPTKVADGNLVFEIEHFSEYAVALSSEVAHIPLAGEIPKTGDTYGLAGWAMLAVLAAGTAVFAKRRRED